MSKLYNRIDSLDLTSILSENEALDKLKESDEKYCKNCFTSFVGEGDICDSCKEALTEVSDVERTAIQAVRSIDDRLAIQGLMDITELDYEEQKELIAEVLENEFRGWDEEIVRAICSEMGLNTEKILDGSIENEAGVDLNLGAKVDLPDDLVSAAGMALLASEESEKESEDEDDDSEDKDDHDSEDNGDDDKDCLKEDDDEDDNVDPTDGKSDDKDCKCDDDEDPQILIDDLQGRISALKAGIEGLDKLEEVSDESTFELDGKEYTKSSAESEIKSLTGKLENLAKNKNDDLDNAFGDNKLREAIATVTTVDNIDQESQDKATIEKAIKIVGDDSTINNDQFRELRYQLANKDYDVLDRLKDYALVRGENVIHTWLRAEDSKDNINENVDISIVDNNINITKDDVNINVVSNGSAELPIEPADDLNTEIPVEEPIEELPEEPVEDMVEESEEIVIKEGVMVGNDNISLEELKAIFDNGDKSDFTGKDWENKLYNIYFSDDIYDELDANADQKVSAETVKEMIRNEIENNTYTTDSEILKNLAELVGAKATIETESENLTEETYSSEEISNMIDAAEDYLELYNAVNKVTDASIRKQMEDAIDTCENDGDSIDEAKSIIASDFYSYLSVEETNESEEVTEDALQVNDIPAKTDHKRIELAKLESEDKVTYRVSYLKEDDEEIAGWDIEADDDEDAVEALNKFNNADTIADELLSAEFVSTGIDGISSLNYRNTNILLSTDDDENIITINQDNADPIVIKGETFDEVMNQLIYWFIMNLDTEEVPTEETDSTEKEGE